ncbi:MAG: T9SS type A sorting domain-containing protein [Bacteroidetes bacterium]|nr:T9SS type A sorting domain-containing protein [Bacteroidota bacterium]
MFSIVNAQSVNRTVTPVSNYGSGVEKDMKKGKWVSDTLYWGNQPVSEIGNWKTSDSTKEVARSVIYFKLDEIPDYSVIKSVKLTYWGYQSAQKTNIVTLDKYDGYGFTYKDWYTKIKSGTKTVKSDTPNGTTTSIVSNQIGEVLFDQVKQAFAKTNILDRWVAYGITLNNDEDSLNRHTNFSVALEVTYEPHYHVIIKNSFNKGKVYIDDYSGTGYVGYSSGIEKDYIAQKSISVKANNDTTFGGVSYVFSSWTNSAGVVYNSRIFPLTVNKSETWTANFDQRVSVTFKNEYNSQNLTGTKLIVNSVDTVNSGESRPLIKDSNDSVKTNNETWNSGSIKQNNWNDVKTSYRLKKTFVANTNNTQQIAKYKEINPATVTLSLDGISVTGSVEVKDPWLVEANGTQPANWKPYNTGFTPATMPNGGVFLGEGGTDINNPIYPFYSTRITYSQTTLSGTDAWFKNWSGPAGSVASPTSLETAVIFKNANDVIKANYKGHLRTGAPELGDPINQRRLVYDGYYQLMVYESMGEIWATWYNGTTWRAEVRLSNGNGNAKNVSLSNIYNSYYDNRAVATWIEGGNVIVQPLEWSNTFTELRLTWNDTPGSPSRDFTTLAVAGAPRSDSRPVSNLTMAANGDIQIWYAFEKNNSGITSGLVDLVNSTGNYSFSTATFHSFGFLGYSTQVSTHTSDQYPVLINQPAAFGYPEKKAIYFLAGGYASGRRIAEYNRSTDATTVFPVNNNEYTFSSLAGGVNPTSANYVITATALINSVNSTEIYTKSTYMTGLPTLNKIYTNASKPAIMVQNTSAFGSPVYEVNFQQGTNWYKATGGASLTLIGSNTSGIFAREQVGANDRKSVFVKTNASPASLVLYSGSGVLNKGESVLYADVRSVRNYTTLNGQSKTVILDFAGALVEPVDSLENGSSICAVKLVSPDQNTIIVRQPDSIKTALAIDLIRNGVSVRSYSASLWDELSINSFEDVQDGDVLVFRLGFPVASSWGYEIYDFNGTSLSKPDEETADAVKLKKLENGVAVYPNPFNPNTSISVSLETPASVKVMVFNILGQLVSDFGKADLGAGVHNYAFDGKTLASGTYFYRVEIGEKVKTGKLQLLK